MKSQLKAGVALSYAAMAAQNIIALVYTPVMLRLLGQSEYGLYQLVYSVVSYLGLLSFGFGSAYIRFYSRFKVKNDNEGIARLNGMFIIIFSVIAVISLIAGAVLVGNIDNLFSKTLTADELGTARILMILMVINLAISFPSSVFDSYVMAHECYFFQRMLYLSTVVLNPLISLPLLLMGYKSVSLVIASTVLVLLKLIINIWYCKSRINMKISFSNIQFTLLKEVGIFSSYLFVNMIVDQINWNVDKFVLGIFSGTAAVAVYAVGGQINSMYMGLSTAVSSVFVPRVNTIIAEEPDNSKELTDLFTRVGRIQFIILALVLGGFFVLGQFFIEIWAGEEYKTAYIIALILIIPVTVPLIQNLGIEIQRAKNMHKFRSIVYLLIAICNIVISIPLAKNYGAIGAAWGTMITMVAGNIIMMNWYYQTRIKLDMKYFWKNIFSLLPAVITSVIIAYIFSMIIGIESIAVFFIIGIVYVIIYGICMITFGMNSYEKQTVKNIITKIIRTRK